MKEPQDTERGNTIEVAKYREAPTHARNTLEIVADVGDFFSFFSLQGLQCPIKVGLLGAIFCASSLSAALLRE